ncbi:uncharacterized protein HMPREF1541_00315 [Cyphellophora europaea CBS 101466]|uniref:Uncharacterized protein n=1 Tax=Cyphellophora europaea (strain CBS 101466) TaxID=1220924 RepID=W2SBL9_CYPE1|nr:uncharacterized protein HMPREF1541_00315 [Cyphellophora europaea CBS 101466]ETN46131.1 hypothetical protein HMPREF1541_00315 [Cyphellophora europaea CBS 101466]
MVSHLAPKVESLALDVGDISKLWHNTAIPGVDVEVEQYSFFASLRGFKHLRSLQVSPPYVSRTTSQRLLNLDPTRNIDWGVRQQQPITDADAVAMFERLRAQIPTLEHFAIVPSEKRFRSDLVKTFRPSLQGVPDHTEFQPMAWYMDRWGDKTILTTRQARKNYEQRQIWVGERRTRTEIKRDAYMVFDTDAPGVRMGEWVLDNICI